MTVVATLHHFLVHFPIALLTTAVLFQIVSGLLRDKRVSQAAWWVQCAGTLGLAVAVASGLLLKEHLEIHADAGSTLAVHEQLALVVTALFAALFFWRFSLRGEVPGGKGRLLFGVLMAAGVLLMWLGAWNGGELAHRFSVTPR